MVPWEKKKKKKKWAPTCQTPINAIPVLFWIQQEIRKKKLHVYGEKKLYFDEIFNFVIYANNRQDKMSLTVYSSSTCFLNDRRVTNSRVEPSVNGGLNHFVRSLSMNFTPDRYLEHFFNCLLSSDTYLPFMCI